MWRSILLLLVFPQICTADFFVDSLTADFSVFTSAAFDSSNDMQDVLQFTGFDDDFMLAVSHVGAAIGDEQSASIFGSAVSLPDNVFEFGLEHLVSVGENLGFSSASAFGGLEFDFTIDSQHVLDISKFTSSNIFALLTDPAGNQSQFDSAGQLEIAPGSYSIRIEFDDGVPFNEQLESFGNFNFRLEFTEVVPEPSALLVLSALLLGSATRRSRRRSRYS